VKAFTEEGRRKKAPIAFLQNAVFGQIQQKAVAVDLSYTFLFFFGPIKKGGLGLSLVLIPGTRRLAGLRVRVSHGMAEAR
jgi:hypothetical protein